MEPTNDVPSIDDLIAFVSRRICDEATDPMTSGESILRLTQALETLLALR